MTTEHSLSLSGSSMSRIVSSGGTTMLKVSLFSMSSSVLRMVLIMRLSREFG